VREIEASMSRREPGPDPDDCKQPEDLGKIFHDEENDIWYECVFDRRKKVFTWTILPPEDVHPGKLRRPA
jgi:hypothetical protein